MKTNLTQQAYQTIKKKILSCEYPPGMRLNAAILANQHGLTQMPLRGALRQLEFEGLLTIYPKQGVTVNQIEADDINQINECIIMTLTHIILHYSAWIDRSYMWDLYQRMKCKWSVNLAADDLAAHTRDVYAFCDEFYKYLTSLTTNGLFRDFLVSLFEKKQRFINMMEPEHIAQYLNRFWFAPHDTLDVVLALAEDRTEDAVEYLDMTMRTEGHSLLMVWIDINKESINI